MVILIIFQPGGRKWKLIYPNYFTEILELFGMQRGDCIIVLAWNRLRIDCMCVCVHGTMQSNGPFSTCLTPIQCGNLISVYQRTPCLVHLQRNGSRPRKHPKIPLLNAVHEFSVKILISEGNNLPQVFVTVINKVISLSELILLL